MNSHGKTGWHGRVCYALIVFPVDFGSYPYRNVATITRTAPKKKTLKRKRGGEEKVIKS